MRLRCMWPLPRAQYADPAGAEPFCESPQRQGRVAPNAPVKAAMSSSVMQSAHVLSVSTSGGSGLGGRGGGEGEAMGGGLGGGTAQTGGRSGM